MKYAIIFVLLLFTPFLSAADSKYKFSGFLGIGPGFALPGPIRFRFNNVEIGTYGIGLGVAKSFREEHLYAQMGAGISVLGRMDIGLIGALGTEYMMFWRIGIRGELYTFFGTSGVAHSGATIGLSFNF